MKLFILSGEKSGDQHGAALAREIFRTKPSSTIQAWGGDHMRTAGVDIKYSIDKLGYIGLWEVIKHLPEIRRQFAICKQQISAFKPNAVICIDYPGFNIRMAKWCYEQKIPVYYYISPQVWAWKHKRIFKLQKYARSVFCILPFEPKFYQKYGIENAEYVGHPLMHSIDTNDTSTLNNTQPSIALFPGSRSVELRKMAPLFARLAAKKSDLSFLVAGISKINPKYYEELLTLKNVAIHWDESHEVIRRCDAAIVTSGTATLETALLGCPQVVTYKVHPITYAIGKRLTKIKYFSLVNLILNKSIVRERLQKECNANKLSSDVDNLLNEFHRKKIRHDYKQLRIILTEKNPSVEITKKLIHEIQ